MSHRYKLQSEIGGFIWWVIKLCRTKLDYEKQDKYDARNIFLFYILIIIAGFISVKILKFNKPAYNSL